MGADGVCVCGGGGCKSTVAILNQRLVLDLFIHTDQHNQK